MSESAATPMSDIGFTRRDLLRSAFAGAILTMPWLGAVEAAPQVPPMLSFTKNKTADGLVGPFGEVRVTNTQGVLLPAFVMAAGGLAALNLAVRSPSVRIGTDDSMILLTSAGVRFGKAGALTAWTADTVKLLIGAIAKDANKARGIMLLRSALHTTLPVVALQYKGRLEPRFGRMLAAGAGALGARSMLSCTTTTVTETVTRTVTDAVNVWKSAEQQYQECYDREVRSAGCSVLGPGAGVCAAGICVAKGFVDVVVGVVEVLRTVVEEVTRTIVICVRAAVGTWPSPWDIPGLVGKITVDQPRRPFTDKDIAAAIELLKQFTGFFGVYGKCLLQGRWSLLQLTTPLDFGGGNIVLPYGIKVCVTAQCATNMALSNSGMELLGSWTAALSVLAALSPEFLAIAASVGITASPIVLTAIAALPEVVVACAAVILAFILAALYYGTMIAAQLEYHRIATTNFADGIVCIEHPTFAIAAIELITQGMVPARAIPPIVTG
jgi:hypothetical protein